MDLTYRGDADVEKATVQYVSGWMFDRFGLRPAAGRLLTEEDDRHPGAHPYAVISHRYWERRFGADPSAVGRTFRLGGTLFEIVGVAPAPFSGTERGAFTDIFLPTMMHPAVTKSDWTWFRMLAVMRPGAPVEATRARLHATSRAFEEERAKGFTGMSPENIRRFLDLNVRLDPAAAGASNLQQEYGSALLALAVVVGLVLLIACVNVANLMTAQAAARAREIRPARLDRRGARAYRATDDGGEPVSRAGLGGRGIALRRVGRALCARQDQSSGRSGPARSSRGLARRALRPRAHFRASRCCSASCRRCARPPYGPPPLSRAARTHTLGSA